MLVRIILGIFKEQEVLLRNDEIPYQYVENNTTQEGIHNIFQQCLNINPNWGVFECKGVLDKPGDGIIPAEVMLLYKCTVPREVNTTIPGCKFVDIRSIENKITLSYIQRLIIGC